MPLQGAAVIPTAQVRTCPQHRRGHTHHTGEDVQTSSELPQKICLGLKLWTPRPSWIPCTHLSQPEVAGAGGGGLWVMYESQDIHSHRRQLSPVVRQIMVPSLCFNTVTVMSVPRSLLQQCALSCDPQVALKFISEAFAESGKEILGPWETRQTAVGPKAASRWSQGAWAVWMSVWSG